MGTASRRITDGFPPGALMAASLGLVVVSLIVAVGSTGATPAGRSSRACASMALSSPRVVILKDKRILCLFDGETLVRSYPVDLGTNPRGPKLRAGDGRTPTGTFRVVAKNAESPYHRFLGLDYPNEAAVKRGLAQGLISPGEAASIRHALQTVDCPDWGTALGGGIGIHGHRRGWDWTAGCIALADEDVEELFAVLRIGDPVEILP